MATPYNFDPAAWSATLLGLFALFAAIGVLRKPGIWQTMVVEIEKSPALLRDLSFVHRAWAFFSLIFGLALAVAGIVRFS